MVLSVFISTARFGPTNVSLCFCFWFRSGRGQACGEEGGPSRGPRDPDEGAGAAAERGKRVGNQQRPRPSVLKVLTSQRPGCRPRQEGQGGHIDSGL